MNAFKGKTLPDLTNIWHRISLEVVKYCDHKGYEIVVRRENKNRAQEAKYHAMIADIARHGRIEYGSVAVDFNSFAVDAVTAAKSLLIVWYEEDLKAGGESLKNPSAWIINPRTGGPISVRSSSKQFTLKEANGFIEFLASVGAENRISWSDPETRSLIESYGG